MKRVKLKILVTGGNGFVAKYLARELKGSKILLADIREDPEQKVVKLDITNRSEVEALLQKFEPDQIYHLAAISSSHSTNEDKVYEVNVTGSENLLKAVSKYAPKARILLVSSGYVYGECKNQAKEDSEVHPIGPYANSKAEMEKLALNKFKDLDFVIARPFNHSGKGQQLGLVLPDLANQLKLLKQGEISKINTFNLDDKRDFLHVKDVVRAYKLLMQKGKKGEIYNIASGKSVKIKKILDDLVKESKIKNVNINEKKTISAIKQSCGSSLKIKRLGWKPKYSLKNIISDFAK